MDSKDLEIIKILNSNGRMPFSTIAKNVNLSLNGVKKRITKLEKEGVIKGYSCELSFGILGEETGLARINVSREIERVQEVVDTIGNHKLIFTVGVGIGNKAIAVFTYKSSSEVVELENWLKSISHIDTVEIFLLLSRPIEDTSEIAPADYKIISVLRNNGRMQLQTLSERTQISTRTLKKRLEKLSNSGQIYFSTILSPGSSEELIIFTIFCTLSLEANKIEFFQNAMRTFTENFWVGWIVVEKPVVILSFFAPNIKTIRNVEEELKQRFPDIVSIDTITGGEGFHFHDWRADHIKQMAKKYVR
ncbi:MAG: winged helix-turn-helix transcriptional regulator [Candidatus Heimdallarchaeota archaeon]|nr:MAG: winged helix-turn-helix transcriptional regulator [Candidatus Heimdallarchaeota archaeon]